MTAWPGWSETHSLVLPIDDAPPTDTRDIDGRRFEPKDELHITLVGRRIGAELHRALGDRLDAATRPAFDALDWSHARTGEQVLIETRGRRDDGSEGVIATIVEHVDLPALPYFHRWLGGLLGRELPVPPAHVTLYTHGKREGIGIATRGQLRAFARRSIDG